jgi:hypothetical protein
MLAWVVIDRQHLCQAAPFASLHSSPLFPLPHLSPLLPVAYALPLVTAAPQPLCNQSVTHSFYLDGGYTPLRRSQHDRDPLECLSHVLYLLYFQSRAHSFALFCTPQKLNSFIFKRFRTLSQKHPGWGRGTICQRKIRDEFLSLHPYFITSLLPLPRGNSIGSAGGVSAMASSSGYCRRSGSGTFTFDPFRMLMSCTALTTDLP